MDSTFFDTSFWSPSIDILTLITTILASIGLWYAHYQWRKRIRINPVYSISKTTILHGNELDTKRPIRLKIFTDKNQFQLNDLAVSILTIKNRGTKSLRSDDIPRYGLVIKFKEQEGSMIYYEILDELKEHKVSITPHFNSPIYIDLDEKSNEKITVQWEELDKHDSLILNFDYLGPKESFSIKVFHSNKFNLDFIGKTKEGKVKETQVYEPDRASERRMFSLVLMMIMSRMLAYLFKSPITGDVPSINYISDFFFGLAFIMFLVELVKDYLKYQKNKKS